MVLADCGKFFDQFLLLCEKLGLPRLVLFGTKELIEVADHQAVDLCIDSLDGKSEGLFGLGEGDGIRFLFHFELVKHPIRPLVRDYRRFDHCIDLRVNQFFPHVRLRTILLDALRAVQIVVTFLRFIGDEAAALAAAKEPAVEVRLEPFVRSGRSALLMHDLMATVEDGLRDEWLVLALVVLAAVAERAVVNGILEES